MVTSDKYTEEFGTFMKKIGSNLNLMLLNSIFNAGIPRFPIRYFVKDKSDRLIVIYARWSWSGLNMGRKLRCKLLCLVSVVASGRIKLSGCMNVGWRSIFIPSSPTWCGNIAPLGLKVRRQWQQRSYCVVVSFQIKFGRHYLFFGRWCWSCSRLVSVVSMPLQPSTRKTVIYSIWRTAMVLWWEDAGVLVIESLRTLPQNVVLIFWLSCYGPNCYYYAYFNTRWFGAAKAIKLALMVSN